MAAGDGGEKGLTACTGLGLAAMLTGQDLPGAPEMCCVSTWEPGPSDAPRVVGPAFSVQVTLVVQRSEIERTTTYLVVLKWISEVSI